ncbi:MAG: hypothetical protein JW892_06770, partial [Anaerolineae bacterium]|nr:hypothetical protein [Anaerolineae bacterium]
SDIDYLGATNAGADADYIVQARLGSASFKSAYYDNVVIGTGGWPGALCADALIIPKLDTARADLLPSTGSDHYALVDEMPPNDADYVYLHTDFNVTITDGAETLSTAVQSGELYAANGGSVPAVGTYFRVGGDGDFSDSKLSMAIMGDPAEGDIFILTSNTPGSESVSYCRREDRYTIGTWDGSGKIPVAMVAWLRRKKDTALDHKSEILFRYDGNSDYGTPESMLTAYSYQYRIIQELPLGVELSESRINATELGIRINISD